MAKKSSKSEEKTPRTLCDRCRFAYGDECFSVPPEERHWVKDVVVVDKCRETGSRFALRYVRKCDKYKRGRKPLPNVSTRNKALRVEGLA